MRDEPLSILSTIPVWEDPHSFAWQSETGVERVFSYGLLLPEVDRLQNPIVRARLATRWGVVEVDELLGKLVPPLPPSAELAALEELQPGMVVRDVSTITRLAPFCEAIRAAAAERSTVPSGWADEMKSLVERVGRVDRFKWRWRMLGDGRGQVRVRAAHYKDLLERIALEFDHLLTHQPRLAVCKLCGRVFVPMRPSRPEVHCRANVWRRGAPPQLLERCLPLDRDLERIRGEKRLHQAYRRALKAHGESASKTKAAKKAWRDWQYTHPAPRERGRPPTPEVTYQPHEGEDDG
jgi:hypothetical protein